MDTLKTCKFYKTQSSLLPIQMHGQSELDWVSFGKLKGFQGSHFVYEGEGGMLVC